MRCYNLTKIRQHTNARRKNYINVNGGFIKTPICSIPRNIYVKCSTRISLFSLHQPTLNKQLKNRPSVRFINRVRTPTRMSLPRFLPYPILLLWKFICGFWIESNDLYDLSLPLGRFQRQHLSIFTPLLSYSTFPLKFQSKLTPPAHKWN